MSDIEMLERQLDYRPRERAPRPPARVPVLDLLTSLVGLGPIPFTKILKTRAMVAESNRIPGAAALAPAEVLTRTPVARRGRNALTRVAKGGGESKVREVKSLFARIGLVTDLIDQVEKAPLLGANGEQLSPQEAHDQHDTDRDRVDRETAEGSKKHLRKRARSAGKEIGLLVLDFPVFLLAMFTLLNVGLRLLIAGDVPTIINAVTAVVFALLGTLLFAYLMRTFGRRHRRFKNHAGGTSAEGKSLWRIRIEQGIAILITAAAASVMAVRIIGDGIDADAPVALVILLALLLAVLVGVGGYVNYVSEFDDGSEDTDRVQHLSSQLARRSAILDQLGAQRTVLVEQAGLTIAQLMRMLQNTEEHAEKIVATSSADKAIALSRSYGSNPEPVPAPGLRSDSFELIKRQAAEFDAHHAILSAKSKA